MEQIPQCFGGGSGDIYISRLADLAAGGILPSGQRSVEQGTALCGIVVDLPGGVAVLLCISAAGFRQCYSCDEGNFLGIGGISAALSGVVGIGFKDSAAVVGAADSGGTADAWGDSSVFFRVCKIKKSVSGAVRKCPYMSVKVRTGVYRAQRAADSAWERHLQTTAIC